MSVSSYTNYAILPVLILALWYYTAWMSQSFPTLRNKRILLLIAHPDDEAMFFAPTLVALTNPRLNNYVRILCLSSGNAAGLGEVRKSELVKSGLVLGCASNKDIFIVEDEDFPDSMTKTWDADKISDLLTTAFAPKMAKIPRDKKPETNIDVLITFDKNGISSHPNHKSLHAGAHAFLKSLNKGRTGWASPVTLYTLTTVNFFRKYLSIVEAPLSIISIMLDFKRKKGEYPNPLFFISSVDGYWKARAAMTMAHKSQMVWFRWGWITASRYMVINDLRKEG